MRPSFYLVYAIAHLHIVLICSAQQSVGDNCAQHGGKNDVCEMLNNCHSVQEDAKKGIKPIICGFQGREPIVCCPSAGPEHVSSRVPGETAKKWCEKYQKSCPNWVDSGSDKALPGEFPHTAAIGFGVETDIRWNCGGTLISEKFVLSAAFCHTSTHGRAKWALLGAVELLNTTTADGKNGQIHPIVKIILHPLYKRPSGYHDIALNEIVPAVTPNPRPLNIKELHPACLGVERSLSGKKAIAAGWGRRAYFDGPSPTLLKKQLQIVETSVCKALYDSIVSKRFLAWGIVPTMLCASVREEGRDTCPGDKGVGIGSFVKMNALSRCGELHHLD